MDQLLHDVPGATPLHELVRRLGTQPSAGTPGDPLPLAYLVLHQADLRRPEGPQQTITGDLQLCTAEVGFYALALQKRAADSAFPHIAVGRTRNNDIVLADVTISKFHAFFREVERGLVVQDAGSRNGTFVDEQRVPTRAEGPAVRLRERQTVRFGSVTLTYVSPAEVILLGRELTRRT